MTVVTLSLAVLASGCIGYAVGVWRTANSPVTGADGWPVFGNGQWHLPTMEEQESGRDTVIPLVFGLNSQLLRKTKHWAPTLARSGRRTQARRLVDLPTLTLGSGAPL